MLVIIIFFPEFDKVIGLGIWRFYLGTYLMVQLKNKLKFASDFLKVLSLNPMIILYLSINLNDDTYYIFY